MHTARGNYLSLRGNEEGVSQWTRRQKGKGECWVIQIIQMRVRDGVGSVDLRPVKRV